MKDQQKEELRNKLGKLYKLIWWIQKNLLNLSLKDGNLKCRLKLLIMYLELDHRRRRLDWLLDRDLWLKGIRMMREQSVCVRERKWSERCWLFIVEEVTNFVPKLKLPIFTYCMQSFLLFAEQISFPQKLPNIWLSSFTHQSYRPPLPSYPIPLDKYRDNLWNRNRSDWNYPVNPVHQLYVPPLC